MGAALQVIRNPEAAATVLDPTRRRILECLAEPNSAAGLARKLGIPRQQLNYHLRRLEKGGLLQLVAERKKGNCVERLVRAVARQYLISPEALGKLGSGESEVQDRFSSAYLAGAAARALRDVADVRARADAQNKSIATLTIETEIRFGSAEMRNAFANELAEAAARLAAKYHDATSAKGRTFRMLVACYPKPPETAEPLDSAVINME